MDLLGVTESHLDSTISDCNICPDGYACCRKDRNRKGGGCALFVTNKWPSKRRTDLESDSLEMVYVEICPYQAKNTICAVMYKPPSMDLDKFISGLEREFLERLSDEVEKDLVLMGDFNANVISPKPCKYTRKLLQTTRLHGFTQVIKGPTCMKEQYIHCY